MRNRGDFSHASLKPHIPVYTRSTSNGLSLSHCQALNKPDIMNLFYLLIFQCGLLRSISGSVSPSGAAAPPTHRVARRTASQQATVEYTLITLNSPDCKDYPVDKFPVRVQYRITNLDLSTSREWISLESMIAKSKYHCSKKSHGII